ncbi:RNA polymerase sigma factor RpoD/SigA [Candidatus Sumerlaeota bacterium]|nr:RNA polymerase sigma factor RpoD/SigA [Candidatus Sumerlaeota bacterium]MBI3735708.1 RNA polymerase sigma factor RpoD/SigA [Candidatus Sumerlaeota bacterium]
MSNETNGLQSYLNEISRNRILLKEEEVEIFKQIEAGDEEARRTIIQCNLKFVIQIAHKFRSRGLPLEDLIQEGNLGLMEAVKKFNYRLGFRFSTYASFWIRQSIQVAIRQRGSLIRLPVRKARLLGFMNEVLQEYWSVKGRPPTEAELALRLKITQKQANELAQLGEAILSLDVPVEEGGIPLVEILQDQQAPHADERSMEVERRKKVAGILGFLTARENQVIRQRFGFKCGTTSSLRKVSVQMGLSQEGVRRIEQRALAKLRRAHVRQAVVGLL